MGTDAGRTSRAGRTLLIVSAVLLGLPLLCSGVSIAPIALMATLETEWAPNYREFEFHRIQPGETREQVLARLGEPLERFARGARESWVYTRSPNSNHYWYRVVYFDSSGRVESTYHELYFD